MMANYYCDTGLGTGDNNGTTMDHAYRSIKTAFERGFASTDTLWVRRRSAFASATSSITIAGQNGDTALVRLIGWPRTTKAVTSSDWTNGSTGVVIDDADMSRGHLGRFITAPDGKQYLITKVTDASNIVIDREYVGATVTNQTATIAADEDYTEAQAIDDSAWTIKKTAWNGDAHTLPTIDFESTAYQVVGTANHQGFSLRNLDMKNGTGILAYFNGCPRLSVIGCLFSTSANNTLMYFRAGSTGFIRRSILVGSSSGGSQRPIAVENTHMVRVEDCALYNAGNSGLYISISSVQLINVNIGVEDANDAYDIGTSGNCRLIGFDVKLGGTNGQVTVSYNRPPDLFQNLSIENFGKILGANRTYSNFAPNQVYTKVPVVAGSGDPYKRSGGADDVLQIRCIQTGSPGFEMQAAEWRFWADTSSKSYRIYCQQVAMATLTAAQAFLEATYIDGYADATAYHTARVVSDEEITVRSGVDDWDQYLEVTGIQPAVAGWVTIRLMVQWTDADGHLYVDPLVVIT
jgi:hypothetical protein